MYFHIGSDNFFKEGIILEYNLTPTFKTKTAALAASALFTALIAVLAQLAIPVPFSPVPFTGQVAGVLLAATLLPRRYALLAITAYLLLGAAGAPVFSFGRGGIFILIGPSGGYLWGFLPAVLICALIIEMSRKNGYLLYTAAMLAALALIYSCGILQLSLIMGYTLQQAFLVGVLPFIPLDLVKVAVSAWLAVGVSKSLAAYNGHPTP